MNHHVCFSRLAGIVILLFASVAVNAVEGKDTVAGKAGGTELEVAGGVVGATFSGDGAGLSNVDAETLDGSDSTGFVASNQVCPQGSYVRGFDSSGNLLCGSLAAYVNQSCQLYFGWRDACDACTSAPAKWGKTTAEACVNGAGANNSCQSAQLGTETITLFGLNTDGAVADDDKFYLGLKCN